MPTCVHLLISHDQVIFILHSQEMDVHYFTCIFMDLTHFSKEIMMINIYLSFVLYYVNF